MPGSVLDAGTFDQGLARGANLIAWAEFRSNWHLASRGSFLTPGHFTGELHNGHRVWRTTAADQVPGSAYRTLTLGNVLPYAKPGDRLRMRVASRSSADYSVPAGTAVSFQRLQSIRTSDQGVQNFNEARFPREPSTAWTEYTTDILVQSDTVAVDISLRFACATGWIEFAGLEVVNLGPAPASATTPARPDVGLPGWVSGGSGFRLGQNYELTTAGRSGQFGLSVLEEFRISTPIGQFVSPGDTVEINFTGRGNHGAGVLVGLVEGATSQDWFARVDARTSVDWVTYRTTHVLSPDRSTSNLYIRLAGGGSQTRDYVLDNVELIIYPKVSPESPLHIGLENLVRIVDQPGVVYNPAPGIYSIGMGGMRVTATPAERHVLAEGATTLWLYEFQSPEDAAAVHPFTRDWWERLPRTYRVQDRQQNPVVPLLRLMDGPGRIAGQMREYNTALWDGSAVRPETAPVELLPWLAWLTGVPHAARQIRPEALRRRIIAQLSGREIGIGTRAHIAEATRAYLAPGARVQVIGSDTAPMTLFIGVSEDDMIMSHAQLIRQLRGAGVVPAGHALEVREIRATWEQWEAAAGLTWEEKERNIRTWVDSDQAGVTLT